MYLEKSGCTKPILILSKEAHTTDVTAADLLSSAKRILQI